MKFFNQTGAEVKEVGDYYAETLQTAKSIVASDPNAYAFSHSP